MTRDDDLYRLIRDVTDLTDRLLILAAERKLLRA
jgi:hypothetical protein